MIPQGGFTKIGGYRYTSTPALRYSEYIGGYRLEAIVAPHPHQLTTVGLATLGLPAK